MRHRETRMGIESTEVRGRIGSHADSDDSLPVQCVSADLIFLGRSEEIDSPASL